jgi:hypothetical protein
MLFLFNCKEKEFKTLVIKNYDSKGDVINDYEFSEFDEWKTPAPQTIIEIVLKGACERYN